MKETEPASPDLSNLRRGLLALQEEDGRFEGLLSSNTFPTAACALLDCFTGKPLDAGFRRWFEQRQLPDGRFPLDPEGRVSDEATRVVRVALNAFAEKGDSAARTLAEKIPVRDWHLWIVKVLGALAGQFAWENIPPPNAAEFAGRLAEWLMPAMPRSLLAKVKPPAHLSPPVSLFYRPSFQKLFVAEQYTLAPMFLLIEAHTKKRERVLQDLTTWILARQAADGSWFCVAFITALSVLALHVASGLLPQERTARPIRLALAWLDSVRNPDGGSREAISLNVWDTSLGVLALLKLGVPSEHDAIVRAADWLAAAQIRDGGWSFHALRGTGLPPDADDTALATLALLRSGQHRPRAEQGIRWLKAHQAKDGSWATYRPGVGDVGCVSVTAHAIETMLEVGDADSARRALDWLERVQGRDGAWDDLWLARRTYGTSCAVVALAHGGRGDCAAVRRGVEWLKHAQNADGGWGETQLGEPADSTAEQTAFAVLALRAPTLALPVYGAGGEVSRGTGTPRQESNVDGGIRWLAARQRNDGGWNAAPVGIYWEVIGGYVNPLNAWVFPAFALSPTV